jgi:fumarate reductase flavoprotein subunit
MVFALGAIILSGHTWAQQKKFLADRHKDRGMECSACHKESPPQKAMSSDVCKGCHDPEKLAIKSADKLGRQNPHDNHLGDIPCESCHHAHKPSEDACAKCHQFGFRVP